MKWLVWLLLLANAVLLGYFQLASQPHAESLSGHEAIAPDTLKIVTPEQLAQMSKAEPLPAPPLSEVPTSAAVCYEWGSFAAADAARAKAALDKLGLAVTARQQTPQEAIRYWAYIPPRKSMEEAQAKVQELNAMGVEDSFIVQEPKWRYAISLGVFKDETLASRFVEDLHKRGVHSAVKGQRNHEAGQTGYLIKNVLPAQAEEIGKLKPDFSGGELKQVNCQ